MLVLTSTPRPSFFPWTLYKRTVSSPTRVKKPSGLNLYSLKLDFLFVFFNLKLCSFSDDLIRHHGRRLLIALKIHGKASPALGDGA